MEGLWFWLLAFMLVGYVLLDGYDLGTGMLHLALARNDDERKQVLASIAPFWDANEVWLIAAGGTAFFAFPRLYASSFSGFYLPLMIVLWLLMARGLSIELRNHVQGPVWSPIWDTGFCVSSALLVLFFGVALGNLVRGVPLDGNAEFFLPLWTNFQLDSNATGVIDWFTLLVGIQALLVIGTHGALWLNYKLMGELQQRARRVARAGIGIALVYSALLTVLVFRIQPQAQHNLTNMPAGFVFPVLCVAGAGAAFHALQGGYELRAFGLYSLFVAGLLGSAAFTLFPFVLPTNLGNGGGLTVYNSAAGANGLQIGIWWWIPGMLLAIVYSVYTHREFAGKVVVDSSSEPV